MHKTEQDKQIEQKVVEMTTSNAWFEGAKQVYERVSRGESLEEIYNDLQPLHENLVQEAIKFQKGDLNRYLIGQAVANVSGQSRMSNWHID